MEIKDTEHQSFVINEEDVMSQKAARGITSNNRELLVSVPFDKIKIRPNFNWRRNRLALPENEWESKLNIEELAAGILTSGGPNDPLVGDLLKDGFFWLNEGERRYRALRMLLRQGVTHYPTKEGQTGKPIDTVEVMLNPRGTTEMDRKRKIFTSQNKMKLTPYELAFGYLSLKIDDKLTHEEIATEFGVSRQKVDQYILAATNFTDATWQKIENGDTSISSEVLLLREKKKGPGADVIMVDRESGELIDQSINPIPDIDNKESDQDSRLAGEHKPGDVVYESDAAFDAEEEARKTKESYSEPKRSKKDAQDALGAVTSNQKQEGIMDIEQSIKKLDKLNKMLGDLPNTLKQAKDDMRGLLNVVQKLLINGIDKLKRDSPFNDL